MLEKELEAYERLLPTLLAQEGKFALIIGEELVGTYDSYNDALKEGYERAKLTPFLVKKISSTEMISYFTRDISPACPT